jgi:hypothetical protein
VSRASEEQWLHRRQHSRCFIRCCLENRNNGLQEEMMMSPLSQLSTNIFFIFSRFWPQRQPQEVLNASVIAFRMLALKAWHLGVSLTQILFLKEWIYSIHFQCHFLFCDGLFTVYIKGFRK